MKNMVKLSTASGSFV